MMVSRPVAFEQGEGRFGPHMLHHAPFQLPANRPVALLENLPQHRQAALLPVLVAA